MQPGKPLPGIRSLMAVINSVGVGRGSKSVGEFTYRYTRGRTIASRRITKNASNTPAQVGRRGAFGSFVWMFSPYKWFFSDGYEKTKHGSSFNQFVHVNRELLGKSPYNSEVNKKLIPNGTQLWKLVTSITDNSVPHLEYASFGTLNFIDNSRANSGSFTYSSYLGTLYVDDFAGITVTLNAIFSDGNTISKDIDLYQNSKIPSFSKTFDFLKTSNSMNINTNELEGAVSIDLNAPAIMAYLLDLSSEPSTNVLFAVSIIVKQYGKIASFKRFIRYTFNPSTSLNELEKESSEAVQEDNTEIK